MIAPDALNVPGTVVPLPQSSSECQGASEPGSEKLPFTPTDSPDAIDSGVVAFRETVGATLATATSCCTLFSQPKASLTTRVAVKLPLSANDLVTTLPNAWLPSLKCHV